jgi:hypothetical protein
MEKRKCNKNVKRGPGESENRIKEGKSIFLSRFLPFSVSGFIHPKLHAPCAMLGAVLDRK